MDEPTSTPPSEPTSILGVDPEPEAAPTPEPQPNPEPEPERVVLTPEEHAALIQRSQAFQAIEDDPQLSSMVGDHFRRMSGHGGQTAPEPESTDDDEVSLDTFPEFKKLRSEHTQAMELVKKLTAQVAAQDLLSRHPDAKQYEQRIVQLVNGNGHTLDDAYKLAKAEAMSATPSQPSPNPAPTTEAGGGVPSRNGDVASPLDAAKAKIDDPTAQVRIGDALQIAFDAATQHHQMNE